ncbi:MAG: VOC family protein, partial [Paracoccaceae bacterium]
MFSGRAQGSDRSGCAMSITLARIDHFVLTVADIPATCAFYERLGMEVERFGAGRIA